MTTTQTAHTPGPWTIERPFGEPGVYIQCPTSALVAKCYEPDPNTFNVDRRCSIDANARLIAAAPALAAVCLEIREHGTDDWDARMKTLRAALAAAGL